MNLAAAATVAKEYLSELFAADAPQNIRLEEFLYDDHLMVWSLTLAFTPQRGETRVAKIVRVSEANRSVLSIKDV